MVETKDLILRQSSADDWQDVYRNLWSHEEVFRYRQRHSFSTWGIPMSITLAVSPLIQVRWSVK